MYCVFPGGLASHHWVKGRLGRITGLLAASSSCAPKTTLTGNLAHKPGGLVIADGSGNGGGMHVHADLLLWTHKGAPFRWVSSDDSNLP